LPLSKISRDEEIFSASRYSVNNRSVVGKTVKSTARRTYTATIITITDSMMSTTRRKSSSAPGIGVMSATTVPTTAMGTPISPSADDNARGRGEFGLGTARLACATVLLRLRCGALLQRFHFV